MKKKLMGAILACALLGPLVLSAAAQSWEGTAGAPDGSGRDQAPRSSAVRLISQSQGQHVKYMNGNSDGLFQPDQGVTRAELAQMLCGVVADYPAVTPAFADVPWDAWYTPAVARCAGLGLLTGENGYFRPDAPATRAECAAALSQLLPYDTMVTQSFSDVGPEHWAWHAVGRAASWGLFQGDGSGNFRPNDGILRCEAAAVFNRLLGRAPDLNYLARQGGPRAFPDVPATHWAYGEIMEATVTHQCAVPGAAAGEVWTFAQAEAPAEPAASPQPADHQAAGLPDGPQRLNGRLYWVAGGEFIRSCNMDGLYFDENGCYTTGDGELDEALNAIVEQYTDQSMTRDEKLRALYNYVRDNYTYLKRPLIEKGQTGWEAEYAKYFLKNGRGNCYNFSAAYCLLCQELGLPAYVVVGGVLNGPHGWVEIQLDGRVYMFDTQLEWRYLHQYKKTGYDLFKMDPGSTPFKYTR